MSAVEVGPGWMVLSNGVELVMSGDRLQGLAEQVCWEQAAISVTTWVNRDGDEELMQLRRVGDKPTATFMGPTPNNEVF